MGKKVKIAVACQGGGTQTAFTAGVLKPLFENKVHEDFDIVSLSGTSGGAVCATLAWYALRKGDDPVWKRLIDFWKDNTAQSYQEQFFNDFIINYVKFVNRGILPQWNVSPDSPIVKTLFTTSTSGLRSKFTDSRALLEAHVDFDELKSWGPQPGKPVLVIGAANVLKGRFRKFNSSKEPIRVEHFLASAAVPTIFPAVELDKEAYWDGLFSDNPPTDELR